MVGIVVQVWDLFIPSHSASCLNLTGIPVSSHLMLYVILRGMILTSFGTYVFGTHSIALMMSNLFSSSLYPVPIRRHLKRVLLAVVSLVHSFEFGADS